MDLLVRELDQLMLCCGDSEPTSPQITESVSVFELAAFFQQLGKEGDGRAVVEGVGWLFTHARSSSLRAQLDPVLETILWDASADDIWQLACLFATGNRRQSLWHWNHLVDEERTVRCLSRIEGRHPVAAEYFAFYQVRRTPRCIDPVQFSEIALALDAIRVALPFRPASVLRVLERLVRCGSLAAWELFQQVSIRHGQGPVVGRWLESIHADPFPFEVAGTSMENRTQLLRWAFLCSPEQLSGLYTELNRRQWFALLNLLDPHTRYRVAQCTWRKYRTQLRL